MDYGGLLTQMIEVTFKSLNYINQLCTALIGFSQDISPSQPIAEENSMDAR
ncbi:MAG: hypothetical protein OXC44_05830 [Proteobacteria bacterium]|nr:hypothetical protein [Pseudomonadota bacterium]